MSFRLRFGDVCHHADFPEPLTVERFDEKDQTALCWRFSDCECVRCWYPAAELRLVLASGFAQTFPPVME